MKKIKSYKGWGIFQNTAKEVSEYGFDITALHPDDMEYFYMCTPACSYIEFGSVEQAVLFIDSYV